jgi:peptidoglycan hydrolase-like protein with peptidoglycan-binding domain
MDSMYFFNMKCLDCLRYVMDVHWTSEWKKDEFDAFVEEAKTAAKDANEKYNALKARNDFLKTLSDHATKKLKSDFEALSADGSADGSAAASDAEAAPAPAPAPKKAKAAKKAAGAAVESDVGSASEAEAAPAPKKAKAAKKPAASDAGSASEAEAAPAAAAAAAAAAPAEKHIVRKRNVEQKTKTADD